MSKPIFALSLAFLLASGSALVAQETSTESNNSDDTTTQAPAEDNTGAADNGQSDDQLDMGQPVQEQTYIKETYGDWQLKCFRSEAEQDPCQMYQLLHEEGGNPIAEVSMFRLAENAQAVAAATIVVPLGTLLPEELKISVDGGRAKTYNYSFCTMAGCFARIGLTQEDIDAFKAGTTATLQIAPAQAPDQIVNIPASLDGFTAAFNNVSVSSN